MPDEPTPEEPTPVRTDEERRARRKRLTILLIPIVAFGVAGAVINLFSPHLIFTHPLVVIFFNPINRYLLAAANKVNIYEFFAVAFFRLLLTDPLFFLLGRWYGDGALDWIESKTGNSGMVPFVKKWFGRAGPLFVFLAPNGNICLLAGASGMNVGVFAALNITGTILRLILIKKTANLIKPVLDPTLRFVRRYQWWLVAFSIIVFGAQWLMNRKNGKTPIELEGVGKMADELEASIEAAENE
jgi:membrane protein DedA with SNARE-associated domain